MVKKVKFPLTLSDGARVRTLDDLREHFDWPAVLGYFLDGRLAEWLEDRYFDELAAQLRQIPADSPNLAVQVCQILGVAVPAEAEADVAATQKKQEKEAHLRQLTADASIIQHASQTAFTQAELDELVQRGEPIIYLCGDEFTVPLVPEHRYIGILGQPRITIEGTAAELADKHIVLEGVTLPEGLVEKTEEKQPKNQKKHRTYARSQELGNLIKARTLNELIIKEHAKIREPGGLNAYKAPLYFATAQSILGDTVFDIDVATRPLVNRAKEELGRAHFDIDVSTRTLLDSAQSELSKAHFNG